MLECRFLDQTSVMSQKRFGALRRVFELNFHKKIIASIFAIMLTNVSVKTDTIVSVKLHRHYRLLKKVCLF